jgi:hypothetical protein
MVMGISSKTLLTGVVLTLILVPLIVYGNVYIFGWGNWSLNITMTPYIWSLLVGLMFTFMAVVSIFGLNVGANDYSFYVGVIVACIGSASQYWMYTFFGSMIMPLANPSMASQLAPLAPSWWTPTNTEVIASFVQGGTALNFAVWMPGISLIILISLGWIFMSVFLSNIVRQLFVDVEMLPFPTSRIVTELIDYCSPKGEKKKSSLFSFTGKMKVFYIGFIVAVIMYSTHIIAIFVPGTPRIVGDFIKWWVDLTPAASTYIPGARISYSFWPGLILVGYLMSLDITISTTFFYVLMNIVLTAAFVAMGTIPYSPTMGTATIYTTGLSNQVNYNAIMGGCIVAIALMPFIIHRKYFIDTLKLAMGNKDTEYKGDGEPIPYLWSYIGYIVSFILIVGLALGTGAPILPALLLPIMLSILALAFARFMAEAGLFFPTNSRPLMNVIPMAYGGATGPSVYSTMTWVHGIGFYNTQESQPSGLSLWSYKIGRESGSTTKAMFLGNSMALVLGTVIGVPLSLYLFNMTGEAVSGSGWWLDSIGNGAVSLFGPTVVGTKSLDVVPEDYSWLLAGFIIAAALIVLRSKYAWWPLTPIGLALATNLHTMIFWLPLAIAMILKFLTLRIGGPKAYDDYGVPFVTGFAIAALLVIFISDIFQLLTGTYIGLYR